jgi:hypothetical protein
VTLPLEAEVELDRLLVFISNVEYCVCEYVETFFLIPWALQIRAIKSKQAVRSCFMFILLKILGVRYSKNIMAYVKFIITFPGEIQIPYILLPTLKLERLVP